MCKGDTCSVWVVKCSAEKEQYIILCAEQKKKRKEKKKEQKNIWRDKWTSELFLFKKEENIKI